MLVHDDHLAVHTFVASAHGNDQCGTNGLPLTPNSIVVIGRFQFLKTVEHLNLCRYIDIHKGTHGKRTSCEISHRSMFVFVERLLVVSEYYERNFESLLNEKQLLSVEQIQKWSCQILYALMYLQEKQLHARNLSLKNIRLTNSVRRV